jgi:iron complex outermembrane receptor protein
MHPLSRSLALLTSCFALAAAFVPTGAEAAADSAVPLDPIEVREPRLTDSPATVTRVTLEVLSSAQPGIEGFAPFVPNLHVSSNGARSFTDVFALRGMVNTPIFGDPAVTVYLDDVPLGSGFTFPTELLGFATGELHRGPGQNTVFGRAGSAGVLQFTTPAAPINGGPTGELKASYGNFNAVDLAALTSVGNATGDVLAAVAYNKRDGYITNTTLGTDIDEKDARSALARLRWRPADTAELTLLFTGLSARDGVQPLVPLGGPLYTVARTAEGQTEMDAHNVGLTAEFATPIGRLSETTSHTDWKLGPYANTLELFPGFELDNTVELHQSLWSEEVRLVGDEKAAVRWSVGAFFADGQTDGTISRLAFGFPIESSSYRTDQRALAAFGEATFKVGDALTLTPGVRVESSRKNFTRTELVPTPGTFTLVEKSAAFLPKLAAGYALSPQTTLFGSVGAGYKPGGFSSFTGTPALAAFGPERTMAFEAGFTRESADHAYTATVRAFWYEIKGYQIERSFTFSDYLVVNAPRARSRGAELELTWRPTSSLTVESSIGWTEVELVRFTDPFTLTAYDGNRAPFVPQYDASLRVQYHHASGWFVGADATATGSVFYDEKETATLEQRAYVLLGAQFGWENGRWRVSLFGDNLTAEDYYTGMTPLGGPPSDHGTPGAPRTYGVRVTLKY